MTRLSASTPESAQVTSTFKREHHPLTVSHALKITCLAVHAFQLLDMVTSSEVYKELFEATIQLVFKSAGIASLSGTTVQADDSTVIVRLTRAVRHSSHLRELETIAILSKCCFHYMRAQGEVIMYVLHPALGLLFITSH